MKLQQISWWSPEQQNMKSEIVPQGGVFPKNSDFGGYVPLFLIPFKDNTQNSTSYLQISSPGRAIKQYCDQNNITRSIGVNSVPVIGNLTKRMAEIGIHTEIEIEAFWRVYQERITQYLEDNRCFDYVDFMTRLYGNKNYTHSSYVNMFRGITTLHFSDVHLRSNSYISGHGACFTQQGELLWTLAVRPEHVEYIKLCFMLGKAVNPRVYTLLIQEGFDTVTTDNKPLRTAYRKYFKGFIETNEILIQEVDFKSTLCGRVSYPEGMNSIGDRKNWEDDLVGRFADSVVSRERLARDGVELY